MYGCGCLISDYPVMKCLYMRIYTIVRQGAEYLHIAIKKSLTVSVGAEYTAAPARAIDKMLKLGAIKTCINPKDGQRVFVHSVDYIKDVKKTDYTL